MYFAVRKFPGYGKFSGESLEDLRAGARVEADDHKNDPLDFVLWKAAKPGEAVLGQSLGKGRPGWHIECSAMSANTGRAFDIHGGGRDLMFPHHENEIAQSEGATSKRSFCELLDAQRLRNVDEEKMSKSLGNFFTVRKC